MGQFVQGGPDMLLAGVGETDATPADCVSPTYRLQRVVYEASPVQSVASQSWAGGSFDGPPVSGFFGVVQFATAGDAQAFFAASADKWHRCNGQTLVLHQPEHGAQGTSRITDVTVDGHDGVGNGDARRRFDDPAGSRRCGGLCCGRGGYRRQRSGGAAGASEVANLMLQKVGAA